jgi:hypothetical protein
MFSTACTWEKGTVSGVTERYAGVGCLKNTEFLESDLNREREFANAALVHLRRSIENNKESEE